jgi:hypothetical protein
MKEFGTRILGLCTDFYYDEVMPRVFYEEK